jgi:hypothetical protein
MVESEAKELAEDVMLGAVMFGHKSFQPVIDAIIKLAEAAAKEPRDFTAPDHSELEAEMLGMCEADLRAAYTNTDKAARYAAIDEVKAKVKEHFAPAEGEEPRFTSEVIGDRSSSRCRPRSSAAPSSRPRAASTAVISRPCARSSRKWVFCRAPTARRCSPAARPRPSSLPPSAPARTSSMSTA